MALVITTRGEENLISLVNTAILVNVANIISNLTASKEKWLGTCSVIVSII